MGLRHGGGVGLGAYRTLGVLVLCAVASSAGQFAVSTGGIGLSGVVYGLFGLLWMVRNRNRDFLWVIDQTVIRIFVIWFFLCIALTRLQVMPIGNTAHGVGALIGILLGKAVIAEKSRRWLWVATLGLCLGITGVLSTVGRPYVNIHANKAWFQADLAKAALRSGDPARAVELFGRALAEEPPEAYWWYWLGRAHERVGALEEAERAFARAWSIERTDPTLRDALREIRVTRARQSARQNQYLEAARWYATAQAVDPENAEVAYQRGRMLEYAREYDLAIERFERATELDEENAEYRQALENARARGSGR